MKLCDDDSDRGCEDECEQLDKKSILSKSDANKIATFMLIEEIWKEHDLCIKTLVLCDLLNNFLWKVTPDKFEGIFDILYIFPYLWTNNCH